MDNPEIDSGDVTFTVVLQEGFEEQFCGVTPLSDAFHNQYSTPGAISHDTMTRLSLAATTTLFGAGAEEPPLPKQADKNIAASATMMNPEYRFIINHPL